MCGDDSRLRPFVLRLRSLLIYIEVILAGAIRRISIVGVWPMPRCIAALAFSIGVICCSSTSLATDYLWVKSPGSPGPQTAWSLPINWSPSGVPGVGDKAIFDDLFEGPHEYPVLFTPATPPGNVTVDQVKVIDGNFYFMFGAPDPAAALHITDVFGFVIGQGNNGASLFNGVFGPPGVIYSNGTIIGHDSASIGRFTIWQGASLVDTTQITVGHFGKGELRLNTSSASTTGWLIVGNEKGSDGTLTIEQNGSATSGAQAVIGNNEGSVGYAHVSGENASLSGVWNVTVGNYGTGTLVVENGGIVSSPGPIQIGQNAGSTGDVQLLNATAECNWLNVGGSGEGTLTVESATISTAGDFNLATEPGSAGTVDINGGLVTVAPGKSVFVGGWWFEPGGTGVLNVNAYGMLDVGNELVVWNAPGNAINLNGGLIITPKLNFKGNPSRFHWNNGELWLTTSVTFDPDAEGDTTSVAFGPSLTLDASKSLQVFGNLTLGGTGAFNLTVSDFSQVVATTLNVSTLGELHGDGNVYANVQNAGLVSPGTSAGTLHVFGNYNQSATGELLIELASETSYDSLEMLFGNVTLGGTLSVVLLGEYMPDGGESFHILNAPNISLSELTLNLEPLDGSLAWDTSQLESDGLLRVVAAEAGGDFNHDGVTDAADYVMWRHGPAFESGYAAWAASFGSSGGGGSADAESSTSVPEPARTVLWLIAAMALSFVRARCI